MFQYTRPGSPTGRKRGVVRETEPYRLPVAACDGDPIGRERVRVRAVLNQEAITNFQLRLPRGRVADRVTGRRDKSYDRHLIRFVALAALEMRVEAIDAAVETRIRVGHGQGCHLTCGGIGGPARADNCASEEIAAMVGARGLRLPHHRLCLGIEHGESRP